VDSNDITALVSGEQKHYFHLWGLQNHSWPSPLVIFSVPTRENNVFLLSFHRTVILHFYISFFAYSLHSRVSREQSNILHFSNQVMMPKLVRMGAELHEQILLGWTGIAVVELDLVGQALGFLDALQDGNHHRSTIWWARAASYSATRSRCLNSSVVNVNRIK
jgi:hypothetical protein